MSKYRIVCDDLFLQLFNLKGMDEEDSSVTPSLLIRKGCYKRSSCINSTTIYWNLSDFTPSSRKRGDKTQKGDSLFETMCVYPCQICKGEKRSTLSILSQVNFG